MKRRVVSRTGTAHFVRNHQREYKGQRRRNVGVAETLCGRHVEVSRVPPRHALRSCEACKRIARAG